MYIQRLINNKTDQAVLIKRILNDSERKYFNLMIRKKVECVTR